MTGVQTCALPICELWAFCRSAQSAHDVLPVLFRRALDPMQTAFAMGEAIAHLNHLWHQGQLRRIQGERSEWRFVAV